MRRERLEARLAPLLTEGSLTTATVVAPAGFGKSVLLTDWAAAAATSGAAVAWCQLDATLQTSARFWARVLGALRGVSRSLEERLQGLSAPQVEGDHEFHDRLRDELAVGTPVLVLVLEDLHTVHDSVAERELESFLGTVPVGLRIVISSRVGPRLGCVHRSRLRGEVEELNVDDLAFTDTEMNAVCAHLDPAQRTRLWTLTAGWPAVVRLAVLALSRDPALSLLPPAPHDHGLADHLFAEVFGQQDQTTQEVLMLTAVPEVLGADLAVALAADQRAASVLDQAAQSSGLVRLRRDERGALQYQQHPMLRSFLLHELRTRDLGKEKRAQAVVARWRLAEGSWLSAVTHAVASDDPATCEGVLRAAGPVMVNAAESQLLVEALQGWHHGGRWMRLMSGAALVDLGRLEEATVHLAVLGTETSTDGEAADLADFSAARDAVELHLRRRRGELPGVAELLDAVPATSPDVRIMLGLQRGSALLRRARLDEAMEELQTCVDLSRGSGRSGALVEALTFRAAVHGAHACFGRMLSDTEEARSIGAANGWRRSSRLAYAHALSAWGRYQLLDDDAAVAAALESGAVLDSAVEPTVRYTSQVVSRVVTLGVGDAPTDAAHAMHDLLEELSRREVGPVVLAVVAVTDAELSFAQGRWDRLEVIRTVLDQRLRGRAEGRLVSAMRSEAHRRYPAALRILSELLEPGVRFTWPLTRVQVLTHAARCAALAGRNGAADRHLRDAVTSAHQQGSLRALRDGGPLVHDMLEQGRGQWAESEQTVARVLAYDRPSASPRLELALTKREVDVLCELADLASVGDIASRLGLSGNTVKTHVRGAYRKLGVSSRRAAVNRARQLGIL